MEKRKKHLITIYPSIQKEFKVLCIRKNVSMAREIEKLMEKACREFKENYNTGLNMKGVNDDN